MKKTTFLSLLVCLTMLATTVKAQVSSVTEVFGKYQFTATVEVTEYGKQFENLFSANCEVTITAADLDYYSVMVQGFAGGTENIYPSDFDTEAQALSVLNPNNGQWGTSLAMSFPEGGYPYGTAEKESYSSLLWTYDATTQTFTVPDFSIVGNLDHKAGTAELVAKFTNVKMVLTEAEVVEIPNIAGDYDYEPVEGYVKNDSTFAYTFNMLVEATDDTNKAYNVTFTWGDFAPFTLPGTFDGNMLTIPYDSLYLVDGEHKYYFAVASPATKKTGAFTFQYQSETSLMQWDRIYVREDSVWTETTDETTGETVGKWGFPIVQRLNWGYATRESEAVKGFSWAGTFNVSATKIVANEELAASFGEWPTEFNIVIEEKLPGSFYVTEFLGHDIYTANQSNCVIIPADDNKSATISLSQYYGMFLLKSLGGGEYLQIFDGTGGTTSLTFTLNDDGTLSIGDFFIQKTVYGGATEPQPVIFYQAVTAKKEVKTFDWVGSYTLKADVEVFDTTREWDNEFTVKVEYNEGWGLYLLSEFFNYDNVTSLNYGANSLTIADDTHSATYKAGGYIGGKNPLYFNIYDANSSTTDLNFTVNEDGTVSMDDFILYVTDFNGDGTAVKGALYKNVILTRESDGIVSVEKDNVPVVEGIYDLMGRKHDKITAPGIYIVNGKKFIAK
ncbi:MAG: hypothetical protein IJ013_05795 [Bacteroidaceae bacterium]|nr:hypothetical protein [Bacteroidaceae bacterium]